MKASDQTTEPAAVASNDTSATAEIAAVIPDATTPTETVGVTPAGRRKDIGRGRAQAIALKLFGPRGFARRKAKTAPGARKQVGLRDEHRPHIVRVIGEGRTWIEAFKAAAAKVDAEGLLA
jgi:hypothetical protein